jgi:hypothetical protein
VLLQHFLLEYLENSAGTCRRERCRSAHRSELHVTHGGKENTRTRADQRNRLAWRWHFVVQASLERTDEWRDSDLAELVEPDAVARK